jgi:hypothetical protein
MKTFCFLTLMMLLFPLITDAQENNGPYERGTIRAVRRHPAPFFSVTYTYTVSSSPIPDPGSFRKLFVSKAKDTLDKHRLQMVLPERNDLSQDLSKRVKFIQCRADTPFMDSVQVLFRISKMGKITLFSLSEENPYVDSVKQVNWKPHLPYGEIVLEVWTLFGLYAQDQPITASNPATASRVSGKWKSGGYIKRRKKSHVNDEIPPSSIFKQDFNVVATIYYSSYPQTVDQKESGIRFVTDDMKREMLPPRIK